MGDGRSENFGPMAKRGVRQDPVQIRRAQVPDAKAIAGCLGAAFALHRDEYTAGAYADTVLSSDGVLQRLQEMCLFVAVSDAEIVGTIGCAANGFEGHLRGMAVLPDWQGTGVALALLQSAEAELKKKGCGYVTLDTTAPLMRAVQFYARNGYSASGRVADFFGMPLYEHRKLLL
jgi:GNAT superfamily N-acetyltransferase